MNWSSARLPSRWFKLFFPIASLLYLFSLHVYHVGWFNDDAFYLMGAKSLLQGRYVELNTPGHPPLINYLPGYPFMLAPLMAVTGDRYFLLQLFSVFLTCLSVLLVWNLLSGAPTLVRMATTSLTALNPLMVSLSGTLLSDIPYLFLVLLVLTGVRRFSSSHKSTPWAIISLLAVWAAHTRMVGVFLCLALLLALAFYRRWKIFFICLGLMGVTSLPLYLWNYSVRGVGSYYVWELTHSYFSGAGSTSLLATLKWHAVFYWHEFLGRSFFRWPSSVHALMEPLFNVLILLCLGLSFRQAKKTFLTMFAFLYVFFYVVTHLVWHKQSGRYLLPLLPFAYFSFFMGIHFLKTKFRIKAPWELITALLMLLLFMAPFKNILLASLTSNNPVLLLPEETFQWIRLNTPATALLAAEADGQVYIKTDRSTLHLPRPATVNEWADWLEVQRVDYVILTGTDLFLKTKNQNSIHDPLPSEKIQQWMAQMNVPKIYENEAEGTSVYQIHG